MSIEKINKALVGEAIKVYRRTNNREPIDRLIIALGKQHKYYYNTTKDILTSVKDTDSYEDIQMKKSLMVLYRTHMDSIRKSILRLQKIVGDKP